MLCVVLCLIWPQIVVGTPGRLLDVLNRNTYLVLRELEVLVMDEGERDWIGSVVSCRVV